MKKIVKTTALLLSLSALIGSAAALSFAPKSDGAQQVFASLANEWATTQQTALIAPNSYQQYLSLTNPMDVAATDDYMAIADGNAIYVYDVADEIYRKYEHTLNQADPTKNNVMELQFYGDHGLYFLDGTYLYLLDPETLQVSNVSLTENDPKFPCSSFLIVDDVVYYTDVKTQAAISYIHLDGTKADTLARVDSKPTIAFWNGELYYTEAAKYLCKIDPQTKKYSQVASFPEEIVAMQIQDNVFICTTLSGDFYAYSLSELSTTHIAAEITPLAHYQGGYTSLALLGDYAYAIKGTSICQYSLTNASFTDFEICDVSDSVHRFNLATETLLSHNRLFITDNANNRISVYDTTTDSFLSPIAVDFTPNLLAGDKQTLLAADNQKAVLYDLTAENYGTQITTFDKFNGTLIGVANVYGKYYFATDNNYYYAATLQDGAWTISENKKTSTRYASLLTADAYGALYIASGNNVYRFTEEQLLSPDYAGDNAISSIPVGTTKIMVDYNGDVYALANGKLQKANQDAPYALNDPLVYSDSASVQSFAFGIEDNVTYLLYQENYLAKTTLLDLPTVKNIPVKDVDEHVFAPETATIEIVNLRAGAMLIDFDLANLQNADVFPYVDYSRHENTLTALKIAETTNGKHAVLVFYDQATRSYRSCLALIDDCSALTQEESSVYYKTYESGLTMYTTNAVPVYKFPHLSILPTVTTLDRSAKIAVLGEINNLDYSYYLVEYTDDENITHTGYVPKSYVIDFDPTPPIPSTESYGAKSADTDAIRRLAFLLLGAAAVLILVDVLIFRAFRDKKDD